MEDISAQTIYLWPDGSPNNPPEEQERPRLQVYAPEGAAQAPRAAVIVLPGGGFSHRAPHEGEPVARLFADAGMVGIVCHYRVYPHVFPAPVADAARAVRVVRQRAGELGVDPARVGLMGFSAGGYLTSTIATQPDLHADPEDDLVGAQPARPDRAILCYSPTSFVVLRHKRATDNYLGFEPTEADRQCHSNDMHVSADNPPTFLFHTADDPVVSIEHSLRFSIACLERGVPVELHVYRHGCHGVGLAGEEPALRSWPSLLLDWLSDWRE